jgi:hypothetical protein
MEAVKDRELIAFGDPQDSSPPCLPSFGNLNPVEFLHILHPAVDLNGAHL